MFWTVWPNALSLNSQTQSKGPLWAKALIWPKPPNYWGWKKGSTLVLVWSSSHSKASHHSDSPFISFMVPAFWLVRGSLLRPLHPHTTTCSRHGHVSLCLQRVLNSWRFPNCNILSFGTTGSADMFCPDSLLKSFSKFSQSVTLITSRFGKVWMKSPQERRYFIWWQDSTFIDIRLNLSPRWPASSEMLFRFFRLQRRSFSRFGSRSQRVAHPPPRPKLVGNNNKARNWWGNGC